MYSRVYVEVTNVCNMNCSFCHGHSRAPRRMTAAEFASVLDVLTGQTQYIYYHLMGEPLTHPELPAFVRMAKERGFHSAVTTNGTLLARHGRALIDAGVYKFNVSLHSFEEGNDEGFYRYLAEVSDFADLAASEGAIVVFRLWNKGFDCGRNDATLAFLRDRLSGDWKENTRGIRIREKLHLEWGERFAWPDKDAPETGSEIFCYGLSDHFGILSDGTVVPCCLDSDGVLALGNVYETPMDEILSSPRAKAIKEGFACRHASEELCRRCGYATRFQK